MKSRAKKVYAYGGLFDGMDKDQLQELQDAADEKGISIDDLVSQLQAQKGDDEDGTDNDSDTDDTTSSTDNTSDSDDTDDDSDDNNFAYGGIQIKPSHKGRFNKYLSSHDTTLSAALHSSNAHVKKMAVFAQNAKKWNHAYGGEAASPIEVEGGEVIDAPNMPIAKVKGPKHEQGGVNVAVPPGTKVYSDRLKVDGKTMQERKLIREQKIAKLNENLESNKRNILSENTADRSKAILQQEEEKDMMIQKVANSVLEPPKEETPKAGFGMEVPYGLNDEDYLNQINEIGNLQNRNPGLEVPQNTTYNPSAGVKQMGQNMTTGDVIGMGANVIGAIAPLFNSSAAMRATRPVINRYQGVGQRAIEANDVAQNNVAGQETSALTDTDTSINTAYANNRNRASSLNTLRANDAVTTMGENNSKASIRAKFSGLMDNLLSERGRLTNYQDQMQAQGQTQADYANQANIDNYFSNRGADINNFATQVGSLGKNLNQSYENGVNAHMLGQLSRYGLTFDENGTLISGR